MKTFINRHFPTTKASFNFHLKTFLTLIGSSTLFALNGVVDNFMVGRISQGVTSLAAINQWTAIIFGWFIATSAAGSVIMAQFYHAKDDDLVKKVSRFRFFLCLIFIIPFCFIALMDTKLLVDVFYKKGSDDIVNQAVYSHAKDYAEILIGQWILIAFTFNFGNQLRELGFGKYSLYWGVGTLIVNISMNATLMYSVGMGVRGAAIATVSARLLAFFVGIWAIRREKLPLSFNIFNFSYFNKKTQKLYWGRWVYFMSIFTVIAFVIFRTSFYARGYPANGDLGVGISGLSVLGLTAAIMNVFTTTFSALTSMASIFVGSELGKGNIKQAKINSDKLKGFNTLMSFCLSLLLVVFAAIVPFMTFLSKDQYAENKIDLIFSSKDQLLQVRNSLFVIAFFYPIWIWFSTSYRNGNAGGKGWKFSLIDWIISGPVQLGWLAFVVYVIVPSSSTIQENFAITYSIFFVSDFLKLIFQEIVYYKTYDYWLHSLTKKQDIGFKAKAKDSSGDFTVRD